MMNRQSEILIEVPPLERQDRVTPGYGHHPGIAGPSRAVRESPVHDQPVRTLRSVPITEPPLQTGPGTVQSPTGSKEVANGMSGLIVRQRDQVQLGHRITRGLQHGRPAQRNSPVFFEYRA
jgi:hypothetical protein